MNRDHISLKLPQEERRESEKEEEFTMYVMDISYFSGKLESYFNYQVTHIKTLLLFQIVHSSSFSPIILMKRFRLQGLKWKRVEPSWVELGRLKQKTGTSQVKMRLMMLMMMRKRMTVKMMRELIAVYWSRCHLCETTLREFG